MGSRFPIPRYALVVVDVDVLMHVNGIFVTSAISVSDILSHREEAKPNDNQEAIARSRLAFCRRSGRLQCRKILFALTRSLCR